MPRKYELRERAERQAETRQRIVEAVVALHRQIGPARTTISAIAERADVERLTVYRHFADEASLFAACSAHFATEVPPPDPALWSDIRRPRERLREALLAFYAYYRAGEDMLGHVMHDAPSSPALAATLAPQLAHVAAVGEQLARGFKARGRQRVRLSAVIAHAMRFDTWQSLARGSGLADTEVADLMTELAVSVTRRKG
ncbi:MAG TPA: TetR family transcriptional regulator [Gemmatimonadaceae bacterium]